MKRWIIVLSIVLVVSLAFNLILIMAKDSKVSADTGQRTGTSKLALTKAMQKQHREELKSLHKLAVKEGAKKVTAAIDKILVNQPEQFKQTVKKMAEEQRTFLKKQSARGRIRKSSGD
jgi:hypothetical protein